MLTSSLRCISFLDVSYLPCGFDVGVKSLIVDPSCFPRHPGSEEVVAGGRRGTARAIEVSIQGCLVGPLQSTG